VRAWVLYSLVRLAIFAAVFALLFWLIPQSLWWLSAVCAALIALSLSYIFLGRLRARVTADLQARSERRRARRPLDPDAEVEDREADVV
jgi:membrane protein implicated in regulation of membrane protease activity